MSTETALLEIDGVTKKYRGGVRANDGISLSVRAGEVFGLLGPNGAGKTTLVSQIIGLAKPTSGSIRISGIDVVANPDYARQACSFQAQTQVPIAGLTATQAIELVGRVRGGAAASVRHRTKHLVDLLEIGEWADKQGETLSGGASLDLHNERRHRGLQEDDCALWIGLFQLSDVPGK